MLEKAIEPFFTTKEVGEGSGLGLSMVYGFVKQSGGHMTIDSEVGRGTTVRLYLPPSQEKPLAVAATSIEPASPGNGEMILVVEDDKEVRALAVNCLASLGYRTLEAEDGESALAVLEHAPEIALLFSDVVLPGGMSGPDLTREVQRRRPDIKVLFTSGYAEDALTHHGRHDEDFELIGKPYRIADLARSLRAILGREEAPEA